MPIFKSKQGRQQLVFGDTNQTGTLSTTDEGQERGAASKHSTAVSRLLQNCNVIPPQDNLSDDPRWLSALAATTVVLLFDFFFQGKVRTAHAGRCLLYLTPMIIAQGLFTTDPELGWVGHQTARVANWATKPAGSEWCFEALGLGKNTSLWQT